MEDYQQASAEPLRRVACAPMRPRAVLADLQTLSTEAIVRRGALVATLSLVERALAPAAAWTLFQRTLRDKRPSCLAMPRCSCSTRQRSCTRATVGTS